MPALSVTIPIASSLDYVFAQRFLAAEKLTVRGSWGNPWISSTITRDGSTLRVVSITGGRIGDSDLGRR